ncbi:MBL fold metallo-hydrolase [Deinococcus peraridilitoris]|uniref:Zn-dependent hydrolase, glyoxylase n=1 Tax=Deinococcus peraridilitoris (strain DSM 19664 / LMG 22246 / CIP 109416 / KR-200) TaxID=937777 RepID=L0A7H8_DEIPD|nr:MBL fold metallo-hydrolase [Deinococcus peraridilitoris]AFZ69015.1 Zn-dependent hydrolase, glyoxylase [Deinococcus peraridilitoris DSM 19664]
MSNQDSPETKLARRQALKLLGATGLAAAGSSLATAAAQAQQAAPAATARNGAGFYKTKVGDFTVTILSDGQSAPGPALPNWGANPDLQEQFQASLREAGINPAQYQNNFNPMLVDTGTEKVLMDTGRGGEQGQLLANLAAAGYQPTDVTTVFLTHGHGDHIGGITRGGALTFPRARLVMGESEFNFWASQAQPNAAVQNNMVALKDRYTLVQAGAQIVPGLTTVAAYGHTPGQLALLVRSGNQQLLHLADAGGHYVLSFRYPQQYLGFDQDKSTAVATRNALFNRAAAENLRVVGYHYNWPGVGYVRKAGNAYDFIPTYFQL